MDTPDLFSGIKIPEIRVFSFGGGVQSTAALVLAAQGKIDYKTFVFANTGDDSENPETIEYVHNISMPYAKEHGLEIVEIQKQRRSGGPDTILNTLMRRERSIDIPVWLASGAPGNRQCTLMFKRKEVARYTKSLGATPQNPAMVGIGFSVDEWRRVRYDSGIEWEGRDYPIVDLGMTREECQQLVIDAGLPRVPKSSCWFCPYHSTEQWKELKENQAPLWEKALDLEDMLNDRRETIGKDRIFLSNKRIPLRDLFADTDTPEDEGACDIGFCMT